MDLQVGDLVKLAWERPVNIGIVVEQYHKEYAATGDSYSEVRVQWLVTNDASWVMPNDLEVVSESR